MTLFSMQAWSGFEGYWGVNFFSKWKKTLADWFGKNYKALRQMGELCKYIHRYYIAIHMAFFQNSVRNKYIKTLDESRITHAFALYSDYFHNVETQKNIRDAKEEQFQEGFLRTLFVDILDYKINPSPSYNITTEFKNEIGSKKADGAILIDGKALAVIELKGTDTKDLEKINTQAFNYKNNQRNCIYVITSNFEKLRFFINNAVEHLEFNLFTLSIQEFKVLWLCLHSECLLNGLPLKIKEESLLEEEKITKRLYIDYSSFRSDLWQSMVDINREKDKLALFRNTQKLLDRFLFILFSEDSGLLPANSISGIVKRWKILQREDAYKPLYDIFKQFFYYIHLGKNTDDPSGNIFAYNGGLFEPDEYLDSIIIDDNVLHDHIMRLTSYDFQSEIDVNILGHIFENSLNEIENIAAELSGQELDRSNTKRKKDGVYYTPKYITKYIVENSLGQLFKEKKNELEIIDEEYSKARRYRKKETIKRLETKINYYRNWLLNITICDPACGSGAFLNQALEYLIGEHLYIDELQAQLFGDSIVFRDVSKHILENNLYGVDINEESIEIAKLSLWLRTAQKGRKLSSLNNNIKCGNSLIDDFNVAGSKAFNWEQQFPNVLRNGGFDVIIGNPPYGILIDKHTQNHYSLNFPLTKYKTNLYVLFIERMLQVFKKGIVHFIIPKSLLFNTYYAAIREHLIKTTELNDIFVITEKVFEDAEVGSSLIIQFTIKENPNPVNLVRLAVANKIQNFITGVDIIENVVQQNSFLKIPNCEIAIVPSDTQTIVKKLHKLKPICNYYKLKNGLNPGNIKHILITPEKKGLFYKPIIWGKDISQYSIEWSGDFINYNDKISDTISIENVKSKSGMNKQNKIDFALRTPDLFENIKLVIRKTGDSLICCLDKKNYYFDTLVHGIYVLKKEYSLEYLLAILNSKPATKFYRLLHDIKGKVFAKISLDNLGSFPIPEGNLDDRDMLSEMARILLMKTQELNTIQSEFLALLQSKYDIPKLSIKLKNWHLNNSKSLFDEFKKAKISMSLAEEAKWLQYYTERKAVAANLDAEIQEIKNTIDKKVISLYGLTEEESALL